MQHHTAISGHCATIFGSKDQIRFLTGNFLPAMLAEPFLIPKGANFMGVSRDMTARRHAGLADGAVEQIRVRILPDGRMSREDAARYLGHKPKTMAMWKLSGKGPQWVKVGGRVFYFRSDLDAFVRGGEAA